MDKDFIMIWRTPPDLDNGASAEFPTMSPSPQRAACGKNAGAAFPTDPAAGALAPHAASGRPMTEPHWLSASEARAPVRLSASPVAGGGCSRPF